MDYRIVYATSFKRSIRRLERRFRHVRDDVREAIKELLENPRRGAVIPRGSGARKHRVASTDLQKGKSGGYRLIYLVEDQPAPLIYLLLLYSKSDQSDITHYELRLLLRELESEMNEEHSGKTSGTG
jgi:mRNA-degrading endonuclease RelE of RelBE toxin-antitoxin system